MWNLFRMPFGIRMQTGCLAPDGGTAGAGDGAGSGDGAGAGNGEGKGDDPGAGAGDKDSQGGKDKTFTQTDVDRIVGERLTREKAKFKEELEAEKSEAARLAKLSAEERAKEEFKKEQQKFSREKASFEKERMELETTKLLAAEKLPVGFAKFLMAETAEETKASLETFKEAFNEAVEAVVTDRLKGTPPKDGQGSQGGKTARDEMKSTLFGGSR